MKLTRKLSFVIGCVLFSLFVIMTLFGSEGLIRLHKLYKMRDQVTQENQELQNTNQSLQRELALLKDPLHLQQMVRQKLGYVKSNEYILLLDESKVPHNLDLKVKKASVETEATD